MTVSVLRAMDVWTDIDGGHSKAIPRKFSSTMPTPAPNVNDMVGIVHFSKVRGHGVHQRVRDKITRDLFGIGQVQWCCSGNVIQWDEQVFISGGVACGGSGLERSRQRQRKYRAVPDAWVVLVFGLQGIGHGSDVLEILGKLEMFEVVLIDFDGVRVCRGRGCGGAEQQGQQWEYDLHSGDLGRDHASCK